MQTEQMSFWQGQFGADYTERNTYTVSELDKVYSEQYGVSRTKMNQDFLGDLPINSILEVGCNIGNQLRALQNMEYVGLHGIELQWYAVEKSKELCKGINVIQGSAFDTPFKEKCFDLVFTSGVLIHIAPSDINKILDEIYRVSKKYIWGFEYFNDKYTEVGYRSNGDKMWKGNFSELFLSRFPDLRMVREQKYKYIKNDNIDCMYLLEKAN